MSNDSLASELLQQLQGAPLQQIAGQLGLDPSQAQGAIGTALPLLLGTIGHNASQPSGASALLGALQNDHSGGGNLSDVLGAVLGGVQSQQTNGAGILGHIFGGNQQTAASGLGQATGLGGAQANQLLAILAPIAMSFLAKRFLSGQAGGAGNTASALTDALGQEHATHAQSGGIVGDLLGSVLGGSQQQAGSGGLLGEALSIGMGLFGKR